jgi:hypothetical protein
MPSEITYASLVKKYGNTKLPRKYLNAVTLKHGSHSDREDGVCAMELEAWIAGKPHSDHPPCVSPVLTNFAMNWNDSLGNSKQGDALRNKLIRPFLPRFIGTAGDGKDEVRAWIAMDWIIREFTPAFLSLNVSTSEWAKKLVDLSPVGNLAALQAAMPVLQNARKASDAAWAASWAASWDAARAAAGNAAWDAAWDAAWAAAGNAAWDAAWAAAGNASWDAAWAATKKNLQPTVVALQASSKRMLARMIEGKEAPVEQS